MSNKKKETFKRGCVYKALEDYHGWWKRDYFGSICSDHYFDKGCLYFCFEDGVLDNLEEIKPDFKDFKLIGYFTPKLWGWEVRKEAMRIAFNECKYKDFDSFFDRFCIEADNIDKRNDEIDDKHFTYLDGTIGNRWDERGYNEISKI